MRVAPGSREPCEISRISYAGLCPTRVIMTGTITMHDFKRLLISLSSLVALGLCAAPAFAAAASLPNGATSIDETYSDWALKCGIGDKANGAKVICNVTQTLFEQKTHKRVLGIGLMPEGDGVKGTLVMPFGLDLEKGPTLSIDDGPASTPYHYKTCLPGGCLIQINWNSATVKALRSAKSLKIDAQADNGKPAPFKLSLNGLAAALDRARALMSDK
jgi:invasion protein IalB